MKGRHFTVFGLSALVAVGTLGCAAERPNTLPNGAVSSFGSCNACAPSTRLPRGRLRPFAVPTTPAPLPTIPPEPTPVTPPPVTPPPVAPAPEGQGAAPVDPSVRPSGDPGARLVVPEAGGGGARLAPPQGGEDAQPRTAQQPPRDEPPALPVDVPQFAIARKQVASGQKPFADGLNWLRDRGYRTVLHIRPPGEDDAAARRQFEAKGFQYLSLEVSPRTLTRDVVDQFNRIVTDRANLPLYVYDRDSSLAGGLWYLHFRIVDGQSSDRATVEAARLGLNPDADGGAHRDMWLAVQNYLRMGKE